MLLLVAVIVAALASMTVLFLAAARRYIIKTRSEISLSRFVWDYMISEPVLYVVRNAPGGWGMMLRSLTYRSIMKSCGKGTMIGEGVKIMFPEKVSVGDYSSLNDFCMVDGRGGIEIGSWTRIGARTVFITTAHNYSDAGSTVKSQGIRTAPIKVEDDVLIGVNVSVFPGVRIGKGAVVVTGSVVTKDVQPYMVVAGNPAKPIKKRK